MNENRRRDEDKELMKDAFKEAYKELLSEIVAKFGWFSVKTLAVILATALLYFVLTINGWSKRDIDVKVEEFTTQRRADDAK